LAALIVETGTAIDSGPSEFGRTESAHWKYASIVSGRDDLHIGAIGRAVTWDVPGCPGVWNRFLVDFANNTFMNSHRNAKFMKVFTRERNPLYGTRTWKCSRKQMPACTKVP